MRVLNYIGGDFHTPKSGQFIPNIEPATGEVYGELPDSDERDVVLAVEAAKKAFPLWKQLPLEKRFEYLYAISQRITEQLDELAEAEARDNGKPLWLAKKVDIPRAAANFRFFASALLHFFSESYEMPKGVLSYVLRQPIGIAGCIAPWNLPLYLFTWKIAPALAAGNTVVAKPSEITPVTAFLLSKICQEIDLPPGVLNIVHGYGNKVGEAIVKHPDIKVISFTGGTETGKRIAAIAAPMFKRLALELGGKNPNIIFADCDYETMMQTTLLSSFSNQGQICLCGSRIFIEKPLYERFKHDFVERTKAMKVSHPFDPEAKVGAVVSEQHKKKILSYIALAKEEGGTILTGGTEVHLETPYDKGYYVAPTIIEGLPQQCRTNQEEIFGPVVTLQPFETEEEVINLANDVPYGLSATIWSQNIRRCMRVAEQLQAGVIWINSWLLRDLRVPFGGMKNSGIGREGGFEALRFFTEPKTVTIRY